MCLPAMLHPTPAAAASTRSLQRGANFAYPMAVLVLILVWVGCDTATPDFFAPRAAAPASTRLAGATPASGDAAAAHRADDRAGRRTFLLSAAVLAATLPMFQARGGDGRAPGRRLLLLSRPLILLLILLSCPLLLLLFLLSRPPPPPPDTPSPLPPTPPDTPSPPPPPLPAVAAGACIHRRRHHHRHHRAARRAQVAR